MGIEIRPKNEAQVYAKTGALIGQAQRRAQEWELKKAEARSQLDFQQELRLRQLDDERVIKAKEWKLEKMMIRSRLDFEAEEKERLQKKQQFQAVMKQIEETDILTPEKKELAKFQTAMKFQGVDIADEILSDKTKEGERRGVTPWHIPYLAPEYEGTVLGNAARIEQARRLQQVQPKTPSAMQQRQELESAYYLEGVTPEDLQELGLNPEAFPLVGDQPPELPVVITDADYDKLPSGAVFVDEAGEKYKKP